MDDKKITEIKPNGEQTTLFFHNKHVKVDESGRMLGSCNHGLIAVIADLSAAVKMKDGAHAGRRAADERVRGEGEQLRGESVQLVSACEGSDS